MMKRISISVIFYCCIIFCYCQEITISGKVKYTDGEPCTQASIMLKQLSDSSLIAYTYTDNNGFYKLSYNGGEEEELLLTVASFGIAAQTKKIARQSQSINFTVEEADIQLKEVVIKAPKIYYSKDTINYSVLAFTDETDVSIGDVLKKMPGIDVAESGQISYQGKAINKFYIENMDLLNGRYGIATQNIAPKDISTVQIMENHQPIKAMDSIRISDMAAINLKLNEGAKGILNITAQLGVGASPLLWNNELTAMYFTKKKQHIATYKTNNTGDDLTAELRSFNTSLDLETAQFTNIQLPSPPNIGKNRYLFNNSNAVTSNNIFSTGKDKELNVNIIYYNDYEKRESEARSTFFIANDSMLVIEENICSAVNTNRLETELRYNENSETQYLNDFLNLEGTWESGKGVIRNGSEINQQLYQPSLKAQNSFHIVKNKGDSGFEFVSQTGFKSSPQNLTVAPGLYADRLNNGFPYSALRQDVRTNTLISKNGFSFLSLFPFGKVMINPIFGFDLEMNNLHSELYPQEKRATIPDSLKNDLNRIHYKAYIGINTNYKTGKFKINANFPISYNRYQLDNRIDRRKNEMLNKFYFEPSLTIQYVLSSKININANTLFYNGINDMYELYEGYLLQTYRYLNHYENRFAGSHGNYQSMSMDYKNIVNMFFANVKISHNYYKNSITYAQSFEDNLSLIYSINSPNVSNNYAVSGKTGKGIDWMKISMDLAAHYQFGKSQQIRQANKVDYRTSLLNFSARLSAVPFSFLIVSIQNVLQHSQFRVESQEAFSPIISYINTVEFDFKLPRNFRIGAQAEQYYNSSMQNNRYLYFGDIHLNYTRKQILFELEWNNIFNTKNYITAFYSNLNEYYSHYRIRPENVSFKIKLKIK